MKTALVITSINAPNAVMRKLAEGCKKHDWEFIIAGDKKSPDSFLLEGASYHSLASQISSGFSFGDVCPVGTYARKNIGYLYAIKNGAKIIVETDDDNFPCEEFWLPRNIEVECQSVSQNSWVNAYRYFSEKFIYPRGLPLAVARDAVPSKQGKEIKRCPLQQGLADQDPDVDAIYRMLFEFPFSFDKIDTPIELRDGAWCPFNSQNTTFFEEVFPLLYLPSHCSFRMTDIWRSFVAQRILHAKGYGVLFHNATVWQERNVHVLQKDFTDEISGYLHNDAIREALCGVSMHATDSYQMLLEKAYEVMMNHDWIKKDEEKLLKAWFHDLSQLGAL